MNDEELQGELARINRALAHLNDWCGKINGAQADQIANGVMDMLEKKLGPIEKQLERHDIILHDRTTRALIPIKKTVAEYQENGRIKTVVERPLKSGEYEDL